MYWKHPSLDGSVFFERYKMISWWMTFRIWCSANYVRFSSTFTNFMEFSKKDRSDVSIFNLLPDVLPTCSGISQKFMDYRVFFSAKTTESRLKVFQAPKRYRETLAEQALGLSIPSHKTCERDDQVFRLVDVILRINQRLCALQWKFYEAYNHWSACENKYLGSRITSRHPFERQNICFENLLIESFEKT